MTTWNPPHINPPELFGGYPWDSIDVLVFDRNVGMHVACKRIWKGDDDKENATWVVKGKCNYTIDDVVCWTLLPPAPEEFE